MKVLFITSLLKGGGAEVFLYELVRGLSKSGDVNIVIVSGSSTGASDYNFANVKIHVISNTKLYFQEWLLGLSDPLIEKRLKKLLQSEKPDIVHLNNFLGLGPAVIRALRDVTFPIVVTIHDYWPICPKTTLVYTGRGVMESPCQNTRRCLKGMCVKFLKILPHLNCLLIQRFNSFREEVLDFLKSSTVIAVSNYVKHILEQHGLNNVRVIYNGRTFEKVDLSYESWKNRNCILYLGGSRPEKGYHIMKHLLHDICGNYEYKKLFSSFTFVIRSNRQEINCMDLKLEISSFFHDIRRYFSGSFITLIPSIYQEPLPYTAIEAVAYGSLVLAFKVGGIPEVIPESLFLVEPINATSFYERLVDIVRSDRKYLYEKLKVIREHVIKTFNIERMVRNYYDLYIKLISR